MKFCIICNLHFGVSGGFFQGAKLRTLVYAIGDIGRGTAMACILLVINLLVANLYFRAMGKE